MRANHFCVLIIVVSRAKFGASKIKMHLDPYTQWLLLLSVLSVLWRCIC